MFNLPLSKRITIFFVIVCLVVLSLPLTPGILAQGECTPSGEVVRGGELRFGRWEEPLTFDPPVPGDNGSIYLLVQVFDMLVRPDESGTGIEPGLAESWDISEDALTYTFHLRDANFSNGDPVTANDVVFSLERAREPERGLGFLFEPFDTITSIDEKTVEITLKYQFAPMLSVLSVFSAAIVPQAVFEANPDSFGDNPVGSGPFMVKEYTRGDKVVLVPNPYSWEVGIDCQPLPYLDKITVQFVPDSNSRVLGLRNGDYDVIAIVPYSEAGSLQSLEDITVEVAPIYRLDYVYLNHSAAPLDSKEFRLALNYAADRQAILDLVFFGFGELPNSYMPKMNFNNPDLPMIPYNPDQARELLEQSGYDGETLSIRIPAGDAPSKQIATILQQSWMAVGINVELLESDPGSFFNYFIEGDYQAAVSYITSDINDDDELATIQADGSTALFAFFTWYNNPTVTDLLAQARQSTDPAQRAELYAQVQDIVYNDGYSVPLNFSPYVNAHYDYVEGWRNIATGWWWLRNVWLNQ